MPNKVFLLIRFVLGLIFVVSGGEKALSPVENFVYVIQGYEVVPDALIGLIAHVFPWVELMLGVFVLLGLWLDWACRGLMLVSLTFMGLVTQAIVRNLPLDSCGCFGNLVHLPLRGVLFLDISIFLSSFFCLRNIVKARTFSLDAFYGSTRSDIS
jgi:uncharacterized membrane protein YphA (DoxX/SURF4 family)